MRVIKRSSCVMRNTVDLFLILLIIANNLFAQENTTVREYHILLPLTGKNSEQGEWCRRGFEIAEQELRLNNKANIKPIFHDTIGGNPKEAISAYRLAKSNNDSFVPVVFTWGSSVAMALSPITNADKVIHMGIATATPKYRVVGDLTYRTFPSGEAEADFLGDYIKEKFSAEQIAAFYIENDYGVGVYDALKLKLAKIDKQFVRADSYAPDNTDFKSMVLRTRHVNPSVIYLASYITDGALIAKQARSINYKGKFIASIAMGGVEFLNDNKEYLEGLMFTTTFVDRNSHLAKEFESKYGEGITALSYAARAYDALMVSELSRAICNERNKSVSADCIANNFNSLSYQGASGSISYDEAGDVKIQLVLNQIQDGKVVTIK